MGAAKWIGGIIGFMAGGPLGALAGYALGSIFEGSGSSSQDGATGGYSPSERGYGAAQGERNSFLFSLLVMASYIIKADGKVMHSEMEFVRQFLRQNFGMQAAAEGEQILLNLFERRKQMDSVNPYAFSQTIRECGAQIADNLSIEQRLQLVAFLAQIAKADGNVCEAEIEALKEVSSAMRLSQEEVLSMFNLGGNTLEAAYRVLERAACRRLARQPRPDRVAPLGDDVKRAAEEKFQQINQAKETIYKARGLK